MTAVAAHPTLVVACYGVWALYLSFAATQFYRGNRVLTVFKVTMPPWSARR